jgi:hypothetical protein
MTEKADNDSGGQQQHARLGGGLRRGMNKSGWQETAETRSGDDGCGGGRWWRWMTMAADDDNGGGGQ